LTVNPRNASSSNVLKFDAGRASVPTFDAELSCCKGAALATETCFARAPVASYEAVAPETHSRRASKKLRQGQHEVKTMRSSMKNSGNDDNIL